MPRTAARARVDESFLEQRLVCLNAATAQAGDLRSVRGGEDLAGSDVERDPFELRGVPQDIS